MAEQTAGNAMQLRPRAANREKDYVMHEQDKKPELRLLCVVCGKPAAKGDYCRECIDRGLAPCAACEGLSLADVEEMSS
jgi:hypothetical protein